MPRKSKQPQTHYASPQTTFLAHDETDFFSDLSALRRVVAEFTAKYTTRLPNAQGAIHSPGAVAALLGDEMSRLEQEELRLLLLNSKNEVLDVVTLYQGTIDTSAVRVAELFREAIRRNAYSIVIVHNHPSHDPTPSPEDVRVTGEAFRAGQLLNVEVLDHIIIGSRQNYVSMKERGLGIT